MKFLEMLLHLSAGGTILGAALMLLRRVLNVKGKLSNSFFYAAWLIVLLRFLLPLEGMMTALTLPELPTKPIEQLVSVPTPQPEGAYETVESQPYTTQQVNITSGTTDKPGFELSDILFAVWLGGALVAFAIPTIGYLRFSRFLRNDLLPPSARELVLYQGLHSASRPELAWSELVTTPMTFGLFRPVLVLPAAQYDEETLTYILFHELVHYRRRDIWRKWFSVIVFSLHWFNPAVYFFRREIDRLCELSCDEQLIRSMDRDSMRRYGKTLLNVAQSAGKLPSAMVTGITDQKKDLKERIVQILNYKKKGTAAILAAILAALVLVGCGLALGPKEKTPKQVMVSNIDEFLSAVSSNTEIVMAPGSYNITEAESYGKAPRKSPYRWNSYGFDGEYELEFTKIKNLKITGSGAELLTEPRSVHVLRLTECNNITFDSLTLGHTEAAEKCQGGVVNLQKCRNVDLRQCNFYGCGTVGVNARDCESLVVEQCNIYNCSALGVQFAGGKDFRINACKLYDCGESGTYMEAMAMFEFINADNISASDCEVYNSFADALVYVAGSENVDLSGLYAHDNHLNKLFDCKKPVSLTEFRLENNVIDKWFGSHDNAEISMDGEPLTEERLNERFGSQLSSAGVGAVTAETVQADYTDAREVRVSTADEFLAEIASDTHIIIDVPQIDLTEASEYPSDAEYDYATPKFNGKPYAWQYVYDGSALCLGNLYNFHISGGEIVTQPRYANVLSFYECKNVSLSGVHLGHNKLPGNCMGGVLYLEGCENVLLESCDLYGCGILGIQTKHVSELHVQNTLIHDCSFGAANLENSHNAVFLGCSVVNCPAPHFALNNCEGFVWDHKLMDNNSSFNVNEDAKTAFEEALPIAHAPIPTGDANTEKTRAVQMACMVVDAYVKGYEGFELTIQSNLSKTSAVGLTGEIKACDFPVYYETVDGQLVPAEEIFPAQMAQLCRMDGADEITGEEAEGTIRNIAIYFRTSPDHPERESSYFLVSLIREGGFWRVVSY